MPHAIVLLLLFKVINYSEKNWESLWGLLKSIIKAHGGKKKSTLYSTLNYKVNHDNNL